MLDDQNPPKMIDKSVCRSRMSDKNFLKRGVFSGVKFGQNKKFAMWIL